MPLASLRQVVLGSAAFLLFWLLAVFPTFPLLPLGRTAGAMAAAVLMVVLGVETPEEAFAAVDLSVLSLLLGTMVVGVYLEQAGMFKHLGRFLSWRSGGGKDLLCRICVLTAISSALFTNDTCCLVLTEFVMQLCQEKKLPPLPFLVALSTSANIGSVATPIGNPQNLIIAVQSGVSFGEFLRQLLPSMLLGLALNTLLLLVVYWRQLSPPPPAPAPLDLLLPPEQLLPPPPALPNPLATTTSSRSLLLRIPSYDVQHTSSHPPFSPSSARRHVDVHALLHKKSASPWTPFRSGNDISISQFDLLRAVRSEANLGIGNYSAGLFSPSTPAGAGFLQQQQQSNEQYEPNTTTTPVAAHHHHHHHLASSSDSSQAPLLRKPELSRRMSELESIILSRIDSSASRSLSVAMAAGGGTGKWKEVAWKLAVYSIVVGMLVALLFGLDMSWSALTAAVCLMALDFCDAGPNLEKVSYPLLVFFSGMFVAVDGFNSTGIPSVIWEFVEPHARVTDTMGEILLTLVVIVLSNVASNVPTVLLLGARVSASTAASTGGKASSVARAWMILAWASTIGGNLTLVGSAANLIVSEQAMKTQSTSATTAESLAVDADASYGLTFLSHLKFGLPSTLLVAAVGLPFIR